jgi:hypothetical protein
VGVVAVLRCVCVRLPVVASAFACALFLISGIHTGAPATHSTPPTQGLCALPPYPIPPFPPPTHPPIHVAAWSLRFVIVEDPHCDVNLQDVRLGVVQTTRMNLAVAVQRYRWLPFTRRMIAQEGHRAVSALSNATLPLSACWSPAGPQW